VVLALAAIAVFLIGFRGSREHAATAVGSEPMTTPVG
jgi:hypothetical protein